MHEISIIVATYNPDYGKTIDTLDSIICQKDVDLEIVVADDGSAENHFSELKDYFDDKNFVNYKLAALEENQGTVRNLANGINSSDAEVVKFISPGDKLANENVLSKWLDNMRSQKCEWSFADCVYYHMENEKPVEDRALRHPFVLNPYEMQRGYKCRRNYIVFADNANGAGTICSKELAQRYINLIMKHVKFAEDNMYRLMMYDGIVPSYFAEPAVLYENGTGVSTSGSDKWKAILTEEWKNVSNIIIKSQTKDFSQYRLKIGLIVVENTGFIGKAIRLFWHKLHKLSKRAFITGILEQ
jgi:glycosyltransferase involved in cell wall biosynthesis